MDDGSGSRETAPGRGGGKMRNQEKRKRYGNRKWDLRGFANGKCGRLRQSEVCPQIAQMGARGRMRLPVGCWLYCPPANAGDLANWSACGWIWDSAGREVNLTPALGRLLSLFLLPRERMQELLEHAFGRRGERTLDSSCQARAGKRELVSWAVAMGGRFAMESGQVAGPFRGA